MALQISYDLRATKELHRLPGRDKVRVYRRIRAYAENFSSAAHDVVPLTGALNRVPTAGRRLARAIRADRDYNARRTGAAPERGIPMTDTPTTERTNAIADEIADLENQCDALTLVLSRIESVNEERIPGAVIDRLMAGEAPLLVWREHRGMSREALAEATGTSVAEIERVERDGADLGLRKMAALARGVRIDAEDLLPWLDEADAAD